MRLPNHRTRELSAVNMTPMIDVVFQLMVFFICTATFQVPELLLPTHLSAPGSTESPMELPEELRDLERVVIRIVPEGDSIRWIVNNEPYARLSDLQEVLTAVAAVQSNLPVILDAAGTVPLGDVIDVYDICRQVRFETIQFAASVPQ